MRHEIHQPASMYAWAVWLGHDTHDTRVTEPILFITQDNLNAYAIFVPGENYWIVYVHNSAIEPSSYHPHVAIF